ncbi:DUF3857 domain-containing protein [Mucilaginibacter terrenus]|nr:DUF3857 domain-containing protein [Mucilaginibacter terrenus]
MLSIISVKAQQVPKDAYLAAAIPDSLKEEANSVVRYSLEEMIVKGPGKATIKQHTIVTVLNEKGNDEASIALSYNRKFNTVGSFEMKVFGPMGNLLKKYHKSDMYDHSAVSGETIVTDDRVLLVGHTIASYPCTIEMTYDEDFKSLTDLSSWLIQDEEQSVQNAYCRINVASNAGFRYSLKNTTIKPEKAVDGESDVYTWKVSNLKAFKLEEGAQSWQVLPRIRFACGNFDYYGVPGDISSWQNFGKFIQMLNADVCNLSPKRIEEIRTMTADLKTDKEKVMFLYNYLQKNMRYVSVQLGIGGLKPFPASFVDEKKYGDCKALSNYMYALLKAVDIPAHYAIVRAGTNEEPADVSFPYNSFNHVIVCVPLKGDTTWLECTSTTQPFGKLSTFTENRNALLVTPDGGKLVNTPRSKEADNQFNSEVHISLLADGGARAKVKIMSSGVYRSDYIEMASLKTDEQKEYLIRVMNMKQPSMLEYAPGKDADGVKEVELNLEYDKFCDITTGSKQFYRPRVFDLWRLTLPPAEKRRSAYFFEQPMQKACVTTIDLPEGFEVEMLPTNQTLKFTYGNYEVNYGYNSAKNQVVSTAKFNLSNQVIPAAKYKEMQEYIENIAKAQNKKLVIRRKA